MRGVNATMSCSTNCCSNMPPIPEVRLCRAALADGLISSAIRCPMRGPLSVHATGRSARYRGAGAPPGSRTLLEAAVYRFQAFERIKQLQPGFSDRVGTRRELFGVLD